MRGGRGVNRNLILTVEPLLGGRMFFPSSRWRGLRKMQDGNIRPSFFNNGIAGMRMGICRDAAAAAAILVVGGG